jgi:hypothetical protein
MQVSSLTESEYIAIVANYNRISRSETENKLRERGFDEARIKYALVNEKFSPIVSGGITFTEAIDLPCANFGTYLMLQSAYKNGHLPFPGAVMDQPAAIVEVINLLDALEIEAQVKAQAERKKEAKKRGGY